jgi:S-adenosylhomocysteine hydrolase
LSQPSGTVRSVSLTDLLRRMAALPRADLRDLIWSCTRDASPEVIDCLKEFGPFAGIVKLAPLFPHGYLDIPDRTETGRTSRREDLGRLLLELNHKVPFRRRAIRSSIWDARLDDLVFREIAAVRRPNNEAALRQIHQLLFAIYDVVPHLPRLAELRASLRREVNLADAVLIAHQHILGTVVSQFEALWDLGLKPERTYVIGKAYSSNRLAATYLETRGCQVWSGLDSFSVDAVLSPTFYHQAHLEALGTLVADVLRDLPDKDVSRLVVLDDGGLVLSWLDQALGGPWLKRLDPSRLSKLRVLGVEQTTFGRNFLQREPQEESFPPRATIPVASVASSHLKLRRESDYIADSVVRELDAWMRANEGEIAARNLADASVGVAGYGVVGSHVCKMLRRLGVRRITVFDEDVSHSGVAATNGFRAAGSIGQLAEDSEVIIGCTGARAGIGLDALSLVPGTVLASASSGNYEFAETVTTGEEQGAAGTKEALAAGPNPGVVSGAAPSGFDWVHSIFPIHAADGPAYLLNGGFPVNFTGAIDPIRGDEIELTRCLMLQGVASAAKSHGERPNFGGTIELVPLDELTINEIFEFPA